MEGAEPEVAVGCELCGGDGAVVLCGVERVDGVDLCGGAGG